MTQWQQQATRLEMNGSIEVKKKRELIYIHIHIHTYIHTYISIYLSIYLSISWHDSMTTRRRKKMATVGVRLLRNEHGIEALNKKGTFTRNSHGH